MIKQITVSVEITCTPEFIRSVFRPTRPLVCPFFVRIDGSSFPADSWDDFVVPILIAWVKELRDFVTYGQASVILRFMDGPYFIRLTRQPDSTVLLTCSRERIEHSEDILTGYVDTVSFLASIIEAAKKLELAIKDSGVHDIDVSVLRSVLSE